MLASDMVAPFRGGKTTYILNPVREKKDTYKSVGDADVHGMVNGGIFESRKNERKRDSLRMTRAR